MSASIEASLRLEIAQYQSSLAKAQGDFKAFKERIAKEGAGLGRAAFGGMSGGGSGSGGGFRNLGGAAMQAQDIAIQLQMGTKASIVLAQQGSQLLSVFGATGKLLGGAIAIGGAFYTMGEKATEAFKAAKADAAEFDAKMKVNLLGSTNELIVTFDEVKKRIKAAGDELSSLSSTFAVSANIADVFGGPDVEARIAAAGKQLDAAGEHAAAIARQITETSAAEVKIAELRAQGEKDAADEMQRQLDLAKELARIQGLNMPRSIRAQLEDDARRKSAAGVVKPQDTKKDAAEAARIEAKIHDEKLAALDPQERMLELSKEEEAVYASMATKGLFFAQSMQGLEAWAAAKKKAGDTSGYLEVLKMIEKARELQERIAAAQKEVVAERDKRDTEADKKRADTDAAKAKMAEEQDRFAETFKKQQMAKQSVKEEIMLLQAKAAGQDELVEKMERELRIRERARQIQEQANVSEQQARRAAEQMVSLEDRASKEPEGAANEERKPGHIRGVTRRRMMGGHLSDYDRLQGSAFGSGTLSRGSGSLADRAAVAAGRQDARESRDTSAVDLGGKIFELLQRNLE